ncbi:MAG: protease-like activity factor CPAF [Elusimicrobia bacterium]|nr:protease-like activity factor CPAF [Elusimicrobiota bacterium]
MSLKARPLLSVLGGAIILSHPAQAQTLSRAAMAPSPVMTWQAPLAGGRQAPAVPGALGSLSLNDVLPSLPSLSAAPVHTEAAALTAVPAALPGLAAAPEALPPQGDGRTRTEETISRMTEEVGSVLEAAGRSDERSSEGDRGTGDSLFRALTGETSFSMLPESAGMPFSLGGEGTTLTQRKMLGTLYKVASIFSEHYAPVDWKKSRFQLDLKREFDRTAALILSDPDIGTRRFQSLLADFTAAMRDYHVSITFHSTEKARLHLRVMGAEGKHFIAYIDRAKLPKESFPFEVGDEVVEFDGKPTAEVVNALARGRTINTAETDLRLADATLTYRVRKLGEDVPQGAATMKVRDRKGKLFDVKMEWDYTPEQVPLDVPVRDAGLDMPDGLSLRVPEAWDAPAQPSRGSSKLKGFLGRLFTWVAHPLSSVFAEMRADAPSNPFVVGAKKGFLPPLGPVVWKPKGENPFDAYIYTDRQGRKFAHVRIPEYDGGEEEARAFGRLMHRFQTDPEILGLVIDQTNNPGGSLFYVYALASRLTDKPLYAPRHRVIVDESDASWALETLETLSDQEKLEEEVEEMEESDEWTGTPVTSRFLELLGKFSKFILTELGAGRRLTEPTHMWGVDDIQPAPARERFTKPVLLLVNELDFSGGDFFPAIMQDNGRATIMGVRTSGAGGAVKPFELANQFGIASLAATWTIAIRKNGQPIENLGVTPDIPYALTEADFKTGFAPYRKAIQQAMERLVSGGAVQPGGRASPKPSGKGSAEGKDVVSL